KKIASDGLNSVRSQFGGQGWIAEACHGDDAKAGPPQVGSSTCQAGQRWPHLAANPQDQEVTIQRRHCVRVRLRWPGELLVEFSLVLNVDVRHHPSSKPA